MRKLSDDQKGFAHIVLLVVIVLIIVGVVVFFFITDDSSESSVRQNNNQESPFSNYFDQTQIAERPVFTANIFDPGEIKFITPLGELNGGYIETSTIGGIMIDILPSSVSNGREIEVYAPTNMELIAYAYYQFAPEPENWVLQFRIIPDVTMRIDHLTDVSEKVKDIAINEPKTKDSSDQYPEKTIPFEAGELIAKTRGTSLAHNWNIYLYDKSQKNEFINQKRYEKTETGQRLINASCLFDYYENNTQTAPFIALIGASANVQLSGCGNVSKDVKGTLSGMWHLSISGTEPDYDGAYATPFSIYKNSANEIIIYEVDKKRYIIEPGNSTLKDPAKITTSHCYQLFDFDSPETRDSSETVGYVYFNVDSEDEMSMAFSPSESCPKEFPKSIAKKYYR